MLFGVPGIGDMEDLPKEMLEEVKITFRAPRILRERVKEFVKKNEYPSENRVYEEATWKYISNYDYAKVVTEMISKKTKETFEKMLEEYQGDYGEVFETFKKLVRDLDTLLKPLRETHEKILEANSKLFERSRYLIGDWVLWLISNGITKKDAVVKTLSQMSDAPQWLIEDSVRLCVDSGLIKKVGDELVLTKISDVGLTKIKFME